MSPFSNSSGTILLVDDSEDLTGVWVKLLKGAGYSASTHSNFESACAALNAGTKVEAVVCDQRLPDGTGLEMLARLRELNSEIPFLLLSGAADDEISQRVEQAGRARMLVKPVAFSQLLEAVIELRDGNRRL